MTSGMGVDPLFSVADRGHFDDIATLIDPLLDMSKNRLSSTTRTSSTFTSRTPLVSSIGGRYSFNMAAGNHFPPSTEISRLPSAPKRGEVSQTNRIVYSPPPPSSRVKINHSLATGGMDMQHSEGSLSLSEFDGAEESEALVSMRESLRIARGRENSSPMQMQEPFAKRTVFPSEVAPMDGIDSKTPELILHPTHAQFNQPLMSDDDLDAVGRFIIAGSCVGVLIWLFLMLNIYAVAPAESYEHLTGMERQATWALVILLFATNTTRIIPMAFQRNGFQFLKSGILVGSFTVQFIAFVSNGIMTIYPTPVMVDPFTGMRIHLVRFATWTVLSFLMTFLTEAIDLNWQSKASAHHSFFQHSYQVAWCHAAFMALSTAGGGLFPFCKNKIIWCEVMIISWILFSTIYVRFYQRYKRFRFLQEQQKRHVPTKSRHTRGPNFLLHEAVDRARMSLQMIALCTITWTLIAGTFTICCFLPKYVDANSIWADPDLPLVIGCVLEAVSKVYYLTLLLHVYDQVFDESARSARRLEQMRTLMSALWEAGTDIMVICAETDAFVHAVVSPHPLLQSEVELNSARQKTSSTMLEISKFNNSYVSFPMNLSEPVTIEDAQRIQSQRLHKLNMEFSERDTTRGKNLAIIAKLAKRACLDEHSWRSNPASWSLEEMLEYNPETKSEMSVKCEAKVTSIESGGVLLVLRDVQERYQRFEVEKALLQEVIVRKKDAEAIRFTRHEVKNGLLAAIGIVDGLKEQLQKSHGIDPNSHMEDLDAALHEILEAILDNAMIREVVYEGYVPRRESVDLVELLNPASRERSSCGGSTSSRGGSKRQFPLFASPEPFPHLLLDPQLIRKVYQNAVSNACKYGKKGGDVKTYLTYDSASHIFRMEVFNLPGYNHEKLVNLTHEESARVFQENTQLQINQCLDTKEGKLASARSAGDGAWIMQKCAGCLGGSCEITYNSAGTTLAFECPAQVSEEWKEHQRSTSVKKEAFVIPPSTWAIVVEDSAIQQKLLHRFLTQAGFPNEKCVILGKTADEIHSFTDKIKELMQENPEDKFLLIIDENLDIVEGGAVTSTVSGSFSIHQLRKALHDVDEERMLALIRSANDSVQEVEMYQSRAHGFLLKGPMKKGGLLEEIKPWWIRRFGSRSRKSRRRTRPLLGRTSSASGGVMFNQSNSDLAIDDDFLITRERILDYVASIDALCGYRPLMDVQGHDGPSTPAPSSHGSTDWQPIRYKLLLLNIELKIHSSRDLLALASKAIDDITSHGGSGVPERLLSQWMEIRDLVTKGILDTALST